MVAAKGSVDTRCRSSMPGARRSKFPNIITPRPSGCPQRLLRRDRYEWDHHQWDSDLAQSSLQIVQSPQLVRIRQTPAPLDGETHSVDLNDLIRCDRFAT